MLSLLPAALLILYIVRIHAADIAPPCGSAYVCNRGFRLSPNAAAVQCGTKEARPLYSSSTNGPGRYSDDCIRESGCPRSNKPTCVLICEHDASVWAMEAYVDLVMRQRWTC